MSSYSFYAMEIHKQDSGVNGVGVEAFMRLQYGTLDHLSKEDFAREIELAKQAVAAEPGALRMCARADSPAALEDFDRFEQEFLSGTEGL